MADIGRQNQPCIFTDFLEVLGVPHTRRYSLGRFENMPFKSLFGMSKLLEEYGVECRGVKLDDPAEITGLSVPFIASMGNGFVIVTGHRRRRSVISYAE